MPARSSLLFGTLWVGYGVLSMYLQFTGSSSHSGLWIGVAYILLGFVTYLESCFPASPICAKTSVSRLFLIATFASTVQVYTELNAASTVHRFVCLVFGSCLLGFVSYSVVISNALLPQRVTRAEDFVSSSNSFFSVQSIAVHLVSPLLSNADRAIDEIPNISYSNIVRSWLDISELELRAVEELRSTVRDIPEVASWDIHAWFKLAWCRRLKVADAAAVLQNHLEFISKLHLSEISLETIKCNFRAGFSVLAGRDLSGRPMLWQRMKLMTPATIPLSIGIKSTWLALDAALADAASNRLGICLVYDFKDIGFSNITLNVLDIRDGALACGLGHPSHISRVIFLDAPTFFRISFAAVAPLLPTAVTTVVEFISSSNGIGGICKRSELPRYLREGRDLPSDIDDYLTWLMTRLQGQKLLYESAV